MEQNQKPKIDTTTISGFSQTIIRYKSSIAKFLNPKYGITPEDFIETCIRVVREQPKLLQCDAKSLFGSILFCAEIGLKPNTPLGHAYILPYKGKAKFQIGYKGLIEIMYRNPRVKQITARAVFENDKFEYHYGLRPDLIHVPARSEKGKLQCVYACCLIDDEPVFVVVEKAELDEIKKISPSFTSDLSQLSAYNNGTDVHNWMEIKAGVKALSKLIPTSNNIEMAKAVEYDSRFESGAMALVDIPDNENEVVEPKLVGGDYKSNRLENAFNIENDKSNNSLKIEQAIPTKIIQKEIIPKKIVEEKQFKNPVKNVKVEDVSVEDDISFELPIGDSMYDENDSMDENIQSDLEFDDDDIKFDFPSNDDDEEDGWVSTDDDEDED